MRIIDNLLSKTSLYKNLQSQIKQLQTLGSAIPLNYGSASYSPWTSIKERLAYQTMDDIYSVVSFISETAATIPFYGYEVKDDKSLKRYKQKPLNDIRTKYYMVKALEDLPEQDKLAKFLEQITYDWLVSHYSARFTRGEVFYYLYKEDIGINAGNITAHQLKAENVTIVVSEEFPRRILKYKYYEENVFDGYFEPEEIMHVKIDNPEDKWRGLSPLKVLAKRITRLEAGMDASVAQLQNGGVPGVMFMKDADLPQLGKLQDDLAKFLAASENKGAPYYAAGDIGYIPWGLPLADLEVSELNGVDFTKICNVYKVPEQLMNNQKASTDNNMQWAEKRLYTNSILPSIYSLRDAIIKSVLPLLGDGKKRTVECDISGVNALQEDMQKQAQALTLMYWVSPSEKREIQGFDRSEDPMMDEYIIPSGMMLLSDLAVPPDVNVTDGENQPANSR